MKKRIFSLILIFACLFAFLLPMSVSAYQITGVDLHCEAAMLVSLDTGDVLFQKNSTQRMYPASITKLLTAVVVIENSKDLLDDLFEFSEERELSNGVLLTVKGDKI